MNSYTIRFDYMKDDKVIELHRAHFRDLDVRYSVARSKRNGVGEFDMIIHLVLEPEEATYMALKFPSITKVTSIDLSLFHPIHLYLSVPKASVSK